MEARQALAWRGFSVYTGGAEEFGIVDCWIWGREVEGGFVGFEALGREYEGIAVVERVW
jgi:predicted Rdx family selenoprotein